MGYPLKRSASFTIYLDDPDGIAPSIESVTMQLRRGNRLTGQADRDAPVSAELTVTAREAEGDSPAGWTGKIDAATSASIDLGFHILDARLIFSGGDEILTDPVEIDVVEPATGRA